MAVFFVVVILMIVVSVAVLLWPLLRATAPDSADRQAVNLAIAKQRLRELDRERENGTLDEQAFTQAKAELELTLAGDLDDIEDREIKVGGRWMGGLVVLAVPLVACWMYFQLGSPAFLDTDPAALRNASNAAAAAAAPEMPADIQELVAKLEQRMKEVPTDPEGQRLLIRTYMAQNRFADAVDALNSWGAAQSGNPDLLVMLADATAAQAGGRLIGEPESYLAKALEIEPEHLQALWVMGHTQAQRNNPIEAISYWERLLPLVSGDEAARQRVAATIRDAEQRAGVVSSEQAPVQPAAPAGPGLTLTVSLDPAIVDKVSPEHAVFVYAKTPSGPPMPLAVVKRTVADLPFTVTLDDSTAMIPTHKLSGQSSVTVGARVSLGGGPVAQAGDYYIELDNIATPSNDAVELSINQLK